MIIKKLSKNEKNDQTIPTRFNIIPKTENVRISAIWNSTLEKRDKTPMAKIGEKSIIPI